MGKLSDDAGIKPCLPIGYLNTGTMYDFMVGDMASGLDGKWYLKGGLGPFGTGIAGWNNTYKSTWMDSLIGRTMGIYDGVETFIVDTEGVKTKERIITCAGDVGDNINPDDISLVSGATNDMTALWEMIKKIGKQKEKNRDHYSIETPWIDPVTGKNQHVWLPTIIGIDSFSELMSDKETEMMAEENSLDNKKNQTIYMVDGHKKSIFIRHLRPACERWGISVVAAAHLGQNIAMETFPGARPKKQMQFMKASDRLKGVSGKFTYLIRNHLETASCKVLDDGNNKPLYGDKAEHADIDINEVMIKVCRCKNNMSGTALPFVISQTRGVLNGLTYYHYLREQRASNGECAGFIGNMKRSHSSAFLQDVSLTRNSVRQQLLDNPKLQRALEICAQLTFIQLNWPIAQMFPQLVGLDAAVLFDQLQKQGAAIDDILASRSYWTNRTTDDRPYFSILDIIELINK